jgi:hypothetical protein
LGENHKLIRDAQAKAYNAEEEPRFIKLFEPFPVDNDESYDQGKNPDLNEEYQKRRGHHAACSMGAHGGPFLSQILKARRKAKTEYRENASAWQEGKFPW